jgi:hypothetical protein
VDGQTAAKHGSKVLGRFVGHVLGGMISKAAVAVVLALAAAYLEVIRIAHVNMFSLHTTISTTVVPGKLTKIEQVHVATRSYPVDVTVTQSVGIIPCFIICNQMELKESGTDDAIVDLTALPKKDVSIDQATASVIVRMAPPAIGPITFEPGHVQYLRQPWDPHQRDAGLHKQPRRENRAPANSSPGCSASSASRR